MPSPEDVARWRTQAKQPPLSRDEIMAMLHREFEGI